MGPHCVSASAGRHSRQQPVHHRDRHHVCRSQRSERGHAGGQCAPDGQRQHDGSERRARHGRRIGDVAPAQRRGHAHHRGQRVSRCRRQGPQGFTGSRFWLERCDHRPLVFSGRRRRIRLGGRQSRDTGRQCTGWCRSLSVRQFGNAAARRRRRKSEFSHCWRWRRSLRAHRRCARARRSPEREWRQQPRTRRRRWRGWLNLRDHLGRGQRQRARQRQRRQLRALLRDGFRRRRPHSHSI